MAGQTKRNVDIKGHNTAGARGGLKVQEQAGYVLPTTKQDTQGGSPAVSREAAFVAGVASAVDHRTSTRSHGTYGPGSDADVPSPVASAKKLTPARVPDAKDTATYTNSRR